MNLLVVDDNRSNRLALRAILNSPEYRIFEAASDTEALQHLLREDFAVVLLDVVMPEVDGFELAALVKSRPRTAALPIIFLTAEAIDAGFIRRAYDVGAADYLIKPLLPVAVRAKVGVFAELYRQRRRIEAQSQLLLEAERREAEVRLMELRLAGERRYRGLAEAVPHIVWTATPRGTVDYVNRRWYELTGLTAEQTGGSWLSALHPDDRAAAEDSWSWALGSGEGFAGEYRLRGADGGYRWHLCRALPERGGKGEITSWLGTFTDIDDQKRIQYVLAEFKGLLDAVPDPVFIIDVADWRVGYVNERASLLLGYAAEELLGMDPQALFPRLSRDDLLDLFTSLVDQGNAGLELTCQRRDGEPLPVEVSLKHVESNGGRVIVIARDISERRQAQEMREFLYQKALDAVQARDEFLSIASHELRTPLTSLHLQLESLTRASRRQNLPPEQILPKLELAGRQLGRLARLIDELLDVSRIAGGQFRIEPEEMDLAVLARDVIARFADDAAKAHCELTLTVEGDAGGRWDRLRIEQVVVNLLANALKFGAGRPVELRVEAVGDQVRVTVRDQGIGIPAEAHEKIFQRFERAPGARGYNGLGLGLYICQRIAIAHGGRIELASEPGRGATFSLLLPRSVAAAPADAANCASAS